MSIVKIKYGKVTRSVTFDHADRIFKYQRDKSVPKKNCWVLVKEAPETGKNEGKEKD